MAVDVHIIIVTHNSAAELPVCIEHLVRQTSPIRSLILVDSGSDDPSYLDAVTHPRLTAVIKTENIGFSRANNLGVKEIPTPLGGMVVFLNPDTFLVPEYIEKALRTLDKNQDAAIVSGILLGYDLAKHQPTGRIDSTGIFRRWYGRWYDRGQGERDTHRYRHLETVPALCGALMCCRAEALRPFSTNVFDPDFFLYKEDIELSIRLRKAGWRLIYDPDLVGYHCRGWQGDRRKMAYRLRLTAATNELLLYRKHPSPYLLWALAKFLLVKIWRL